MAQKTITDLDGYAVRIEASGAGERAVLVDVRRADGASEVHEVSPAAALAAAAAATGRTAAQCAIVVRAWLADCRAQARAAGGWS